MGSIWQGKIINNINAYLEAHRLPIKLNRGGICRGLSILHAKYVLEGREAEFERLLELLAGNAKILRGQGDESDKEIFNFLTELFAVHNPREDNRHHVTYAESYEQFFIEDKPIQSLYKLGLVATPKAWADIFTQLDLQDDEVMLVGSTRHAISIIKRGDEYKIYDPNNSELYKTFKENELEGLMGYLRDTTFRYQDAERLGLSINIISHHEKDLKLRGFPQQSKLCEAHFSKENDAVAYKKDGYEETSLIFAARVGDLESIKWLLNQNPDKKVIMEAAILTIQYGNPKALSPILKALKQRGFTPADKVELLRNAVSFGGIEMLETLLQNPSLQETYQGLLQRMPEEYLSLSLKGGNPKVIQRVLEGIFQYHEPEDILKRLWAPMKLEEDLFFQAIQSQNHEGLRALCGELKKHSSGQALVEGLKKNPKYLAQAIKNNNPEMVRCLLEEFGYDPNSPEEKALINEISLRLSAIKKTDITLLKALRDYGMEFSTAAHHLIEKKDRSKIGVLGHFSIAFMRFSEFLSRHLLGKTEEIQVATTFESDEENLEFSEAFQASLEENPQQPGKIVIAIGVSIHEMAQLPDDLDDYEGDYILCQNERRLFYIGLDGQIEVINLKDFDKFLIELESKVAKEDLATWSLGSSEMKDLIAENRGFAHGTADEVNVERPSSSREPSEQAISAFIAMKRKTCELRAGAVKAPEKQEKELENLGNKAQDAGLESSSHP